MAEGATKEEAARRFPTIQKTEYESLPVEIPDDFLSPLPDSSKMSVSQIDFKNTVLKEYKGLYAVVLDNVLSQKECDELIHMAELSVGGHRGKDEIESAGWRPALVNAGRNHEVFAPEYRNSDRIIWDDKEIVRRLFQRILQAEEVKEYLSVLDGKKYVPAVGPSANYEGERWIVSKQGPNERMRFLKYGPGQFFKGTNIIRFSCFRESNCA
jgi:hypothetical protein